MSSKPMRLSEGCVLITAFPRDVILPEAVESSGLKVSTLLSLHRTLTKNSLDWELVVPRPGRINIVSDEPSE